ncbi:MAG TPA: molybdenum ABC transporter ATP-binding protein [Pasteurellaceae bacterium]|nr:molybdenum ABC transporter ATP-binding protein [Pasteurellaceae bacterium]
MLNINLTKRLGQLELKANLDLPSKGITVLFGLSGSGKSSLINLISGLLTPDHGYIRLNERVLVDMEQSVNLPPDKRHIGYVFQDARLFPHYRVKGNLCYGMRQKDPVELARIVQLLGIENLLKRYPITLSGGEKQRVAIGRALLSNPDILLMDEPLSALDLPRKRELLTYLERLTRQIHIPILYVTHNLDELLTLADRVVLFENGKVKLFENTEQFLHSPEFMPWKIEYANSNLSH